MTGTFPLTIPFQNRSPRTLQWLARFVLVLMICSSLAVGGCGVAIATWITLGTQLITTILPTLPMLFASFSSLLGKTLNAAQVAKLTAIFTGAGDLLNQAVTAMNSLGANPTATDIQKVQGILTQIKTNLSTIITDVQITDPATVMKIQGIANTFIDLATAVLGILPVVKAGGKMTARHVSKAELATMTPEAWAGKFNAAAHKPTGNTVVDAAFLSVHAVPVH